MLDRALLLLNEIGDQGEQTAFGLGRRFVIRLIRFFAVIDPFQYRSSIFPTYGFAQCSTQEKSD
jgi:hypothetical protein